MTAEKSNDFTQGPIPAVVTRMALPLIAAQLVNVLYNLVDRIYIGHIPGGGTAPLTGVGVALPVITLVSAFAGLFGQGGAPLCSIARGRGDREQASRVMGNALTLLLLSAVLLTALSLATARPVLFLFGASEDTIGYALDYLRIYLLGTPFVFIALGMNVYISAQGFATRSMTTVLLGAALNIVLDPLFIFTFRMGVAGAAVATVLSQLASAAWCLSFLRGKRALLELSRRTMALRGPVVKGILSLGVTNFIMGATNSLILAVANRQLSLWGGDVYIGVMTVVQALRTAFLEIIRGFGAGLQPVIGYNYGAGERGRVLACIRFCTLVAVAVALLAWGLFMLLPEPLIRLFTPEEALVRLAVPAVRIYYCGFAFFSLQAISQNTYQGLGRARQAIFFSLFRKVLVVVPLMLVLPGLFGLGVDGVFWSEPISDLVGGLAAFVTMLLTVYFPIRRELKKEAAR